MANRMGIVRPLVVVVLVALWLGVDAIGGQSIGKLSTVTTNSQETFLPRSAESVEAQGILRRFDETGQLPVMVVIMGKRAVDDAFPSGSPPPGPPGAAYATDLVAAVTVDGTSLADLLAPDAAGVTQKASDGGGVLVVLPLDAAKAEQRVNGEARQVRIVDALRTQVPAFAPGAVVHVTGPAAFAADLVAAFSGIDGMLLVVALGAVLLILVLVYRAVVLPLLVLLSAVSGLSLAGLVVYELAKAGHLIVNGQSQGILFILVVGAATDYGLLLVSRFREELASTTSTVTALRRSWRACIEPVAASAGTVTLGLLCLLAADLNSVRSLGPVGSIGIGAALLAALTFLPALLVLGRWIFWPRVPHPPGHMPEGAPAHARARQGVWHRTAALVRRRPRAVWLVTMAALCVCTLGLPAFKASGTSDADVLLGDQDSSAGQRIVSAQFDAGASDPIRLVTPVDLADRVAATAMEVPGIAAVTVGEDVIDGQVVIDASPADPQQAGETVQGVRDAVARVAPGQVLVGGSEALDLDTRDTARADLVRIIPLVLLVVLIVLTLLLRSVVAAAVLTVATLLSFAATIGVSALMFNHVFRFPGADPTVPLLAFVFLVALGVDYSIFLMSRAREEVGLHGPVDGVARALTSTGGVITSAGVVLAATFAALAVIPLLFLAQIAFLVAFGVLLDTLVVRSLLVPALATDLGARTWWPSRLARTDPRPDEAGEPD